MVVLHKKHHVLLNLRQCDSHGQVLRTRTRKPSLGSSRKNAQPRAIFGVAMRLASRAKKRDSLTKTAQSILTSADSQSSWTRSPRGIAIIAESLPSRNRNHRGLTPLADSLPSW